MGKRKRKCGPGGKSAASVAILPLGSVSGDDVAFAARTMRDIFGVRVCVRARHDLSPRYYSADRFQYNAEKIIEGLLFSWFMDHRQTRVIGLADIDMYVSGCSYVFGYAHLRDGVMVCSTNRLSDGGTRTAVGHALRRRRLVKVLVHEFAHTFNLVHCYRESCVLSAVGGLSDLDRLNRELCDDCLAQVRDGLCVGSNSAEWHHARGLSLLRRGEDAMLRRAEEELRIAVQLSPEKAMYHNSYGVVLTHLGRYDDAVLAFT